MAFNGEFYGIYTPAVTPCHDDMSIDRDGFLKVLDHLIDEGVDGIIIAGTTGEYYAHSMEERVDLLKIGAAHVAGRVPVVGGTGALRTEDSIMLAQEAKAAGCDAILIATPPYSLPTGRENALHALAVERSVDMPVMLYNYPGRMGSEMDEEFLDRVGQSGNFKAIKESSGDINRVHLLARRYPHIALSFAGWMTKRLNSLHGARSGFVRQVTLPCQPIKRSSKLVLKIALTAHDVLGQEAWIGSCPQPHSI